MSWLNGPLPREIKETGPDSERMKLKPYLLSLLNRNTDEIRNAIIGANNAIASVRAKPKMA